MSNIKKILPVVVFFVAIFFLSGCSLTKLATPQSNTMVNATFIKSEDNGLTWKEKTRIDDKKNIEGINVLSMAINPNDSNVIYIGTEANGLFVTKNKGEAWFQVAFPERVYGLVFDPQNADIIYASGVFNKRGKIYKRLSEDQEWKEIYTEPSEETVISSLAINKNNPQILYAGTSDGMIIKTTDGGLTWSNLGKLGGPIIGIIFDNNNDGHIFLGVFQVGVFESKDGGKSLDNIIAKMDAIGKTSSVYSLTSDFFNQGAIYVGTENGIFRRSVNGNWSVVNIIESSKLFPIRAIAVNPQNSEEIIYSSAKAIYKSINGGTTWATFQLDTNKEVSVLRYDATNPANIYAGMRSF